jgi:hypothetical protein
MIRILELSLDTTKKVEREMMRMKSNLKWKIQHSIIFFAHE